MGTSYKGHIHQYFVQKVFIAVLFYLPSASPSIEASISDKLLILVLYQVSVVFFDVTTFAKQLI